MKCRQCGNEDHSGARRCPKCGADLKQGIWQNIARLFKDNNGKSPARGHQAQSPSTPFVLRVTEVFFITGRGVVVTGAIEEGLIHTGDRVRFTDTNGMERSVTVSEIEIFREIREQARAGERVGLYLSDIGQEDIATDTIITRSE